MLTVMAELNDPTRDDVKVLVIDDIYWTMKRFGRPKKDYLKSELEEHEGFGLGADLGLPLATRQALSVPYTKTSKGKYGGLAITRADAKKAATVKAAIDLVHKRANSKK